MSTFGLGKGRGKLIFERRRGGLTALRDVEPVEAGDTGIRCRRCGERILKDELFGVCGGTALCELCLEDEWRELTAEEKFEMLGFETEAL